MKPDIEAIVLAAGFSRRFGSKNKLLTKLGGRPIIEHVFEVVAESRFASVNVVVNSSDEIISILAARYSFQVIVNNLANQGVGTSISCGLSMLPNRFDGFAIILGDMPFVKLKTYQLLLNAFDTNSGTSIIRPGYNGRPGHPVLFPEQRRADCIDLAMDLGAKSVIDRHKADLRMIDVDDSGVVRDIDVPPDDSGHFEVC